MLGVYSRGTLQGLLTLSARAAGRRSRTLNGEALRAHGSPGSLCSGALSSGAPSHSGDTRTVCADSLHLQVPGGAQVFLELTTRCVFPAAGGQQRNHEKCLANDGETTGRLHQRARAQRVLSADFRHSWVYVAESADPCPASAERTPAALCSRKRKVPRLPGEAVWGRHSSPAWVRSEYFFRNMRFETIFSYAIGYDLIFLLLLQLNSQSIIWNCMKTLRK